MKTIDIKNYNLLFLPSNEHKYQKIFFFTLEIELNAKNTGFSTTQSLALQYNCFITQWQTGYVLN